MIYQGWPADFDEWFRALQRLIRFEIRAERERQQLTEPIRLVMPFYPNGAPPIFHLSDEDCGWQLDQIDRGQINRN